MHYCVCGIEETCFEAFAYEFMENLEELLLVVVSGSYNYHNNHKSLANGKELNKIAYLYYHETWNIRIVNTNLIYYYYRTPHYNYIINPFATGNKRNILLCGC